MIVEGIHINGIYKHWKKGDLYKVQEIAYDEDTGEARVIYFKCDENGIFQPIRLSSFGHCVAQPFSRTVKEFTACCVGGYPGNPAIYRFQLFKEPTN